MISRLINCHEFYVIYSFIHSRKTLKTLELYESISCILNLMFKIPFFNFS